MSVIRPPVDATPAVAAPEDAAGETGRPVESLRTAERFAVWAMREWVARRRIGDARGGLIRDGFHYASLGGAVSPFFAFMDRMTAGARRAIDIAELHRSRLAPDEEALLAAVAALQRDDEDVAYAALAPLLPPATSRRILPLLASFALKMAEARLILPPPPACALHGARALRLANPGIALVH